MTEKLTWGKGTWPGSNMGKVYPAGQRRARWPGGVGRAGLRWMLCQRPSEPAPGTRQSPAAAGGQSCLPPARHALRGLASGRPPASPVPSSSTAGSPSPEDPAFTSVLPPPGQERGSSRGQAPSLLSTELQAPQGGRPLYHSARVAKYHRLGGLNTRKLFPRGLGSQGPEGQPRAASPRECLWHCMSKFPLKRTPGELDWGHSHDLFLPESPLRRPRLQR